jgi:hypothetical protein
MTLFMTDLAPKGLLPVLRNDFGYQPVNGAGIVIATRNALPMGFPQKRVLRERS